MNVPEDCRDTFAKIRELMEYASRIEFLAEIQLLPVLNGKSHLAKKLNAHRKQYRVQEQELATARIATTGWHLKLSREEVNIALQQARRQERSIWRFFQPGWWRLRSLLRRSYDFGSHPVQPTYSHVLEPLQAEHNAAAQLDAVEAAARAELAFEGTFASFSDRITALADGVDKLSPALQAFHRRVLTVSDGSDTVLALAKLKPTVEQLASEVDHLMVDTNDLSLLALRQDVNQIGESLSELADFLPCLKELSNLPVPIANAWRRFPLNENQLEAAIAHHTIDGLLRADPQVARFNSGTQAAQLGKLEQIHDQWYAVSAAAIRARVCRRFLENVRIASLPHGQLNADQKTLKARYNRGRRNWSTSSIKRCGSAIRDLVDGDTGLVLQDLKPVWLMSPLSVSDALPLANSFDVVIFDEASQVTLEEAVPAIFRARQLIVVGDEMQLPPTSFFASKGAEDEETLLVEDATGQKVEYDLSSNSLLNHAARNLPATMLGWHYRSRSESLISFSNCAFYQGRLLTVPEVELPAESMTEIVVHAANEGFSGIDRLLERPLSFHLLENGIYEQRRNASEADYIAHLVRGLLVRETGLSIGIIAFSESQQDEIEQALRRLAREDDDFRGRLEAEWEREQDEQFVGLLVKNLENIQGDERDVIILSVCYGPGRNGVLSWMSGGPRTTNPGTDGTFPRPLISCQESTLPSNPSIPPLTPSPSVS